MKDFRIGDLIHVRRDLAWYHHHSKGDYTYVYKIAEITPDQISVDTIGIIYFENKQFVVLKPKDMYYKEHIRNLNKIERFVLLKERKLKSIYEEAK